MSAKPDTFFDVKTTSFESTQGPVVLPIFYQDFSALHFVFFVDYEKALSKLAGTAFSPCKLFNGKAGVIFTFFEYRETAIGPYNEVCLGILCYHANHKQPALIVPQFLKDAKMWTMGIYVVDLPVSTEIARVAGSEIWTYPKFVTEIPFHLDGKQFSTAVMDPAISEPIFSLEGRVGFLGLGRHLSKIVKVGSFVSHTMHQGTPLSILSEVEDQGRFANLGFSGKIQVNANSKHRMAVNLRDLGLEGKKPIVVLRAEQVRMKLNDGFPMS
ncbi:MAG: acetoacetate decarboxylase family protein [Myxococcota bacterium]|nr:acetoacetate decarboxylase family protein [Myxococcota bacterium]